MMKKKRIAVLPGDGIGPEIVEEGIKVLKETGKQFGYQFDFSFGLVGGGAIERLKSPLPEETLKQCEKADAVLLGAVGGPRWDRNPSHLRPEKALLGLRQKLGLYANLRPAVLFSGMKKSSALRPEVLDGVDLLVVRELTGGIYFGEKKTVDTSKGTYAIDTLTYHEQEIERIARRAFHLAKGRSKKVTSVDKANVLESSRLWRQVMERMGRSFPDIQLEHMLVDNCAMQIISRPSDFDVIVTENMFGDILSDEAAILTGSIGMLPSASLGEGTFGMYEPVHGSAPDIANLGIANPIATILSVAMMFRHSFQDEEAARCIEFVVQDTLASGARTADVAAVGDLPMGTEEMGDRIVDGIKRYGSVPV